MGSSVIRGQGDAESVPCALAAAAGCRVHKRRYQVPEGALTWEIDDYVVREVTDDPEFRNLNLAR